MAWFDRYLKGLAEPDTAADGYRRLLATRFDDLADRHNLGAGYYDPVDGNQPYRIAGLSVCDRMSFYFKSRLAITAPGNDQLIATEDWKTACKDDALPQPGTPDTPPLNPATPNDRAPDGSGGALGSAALALLGLVALRRRQWVASG